MKRLLLPVLIALSLPPEIKAEEPYYSNTWMGNDYQLFINDKEPLHNGYIYNLTVCFHASQKSFHLFHLYLL